MKDIKFTIVVVELSEFGIYGDLGEMDEHAFYQCPLFYPYWDFVGELVARMEIENFVALGVSYVCDNVAFSWEILKCMMFLTLTAIARMVMWKTRQNV